MRLNALVVGVSYVLIAIGCTTAHERKRVGNAPIGSTVTISAQDFDLHRIDAIVLALNEEVIASIHPYHITRGTKHPDRQYAAFELAYLNPNPIHESLSEDDAYLVIDRMTPDPERDGDLMLNPGSQVINIGGFDSTLIIWKPEESINQHRWIYESGGGEVCGGGVSFVIKRDS